MKILLDTCAILWAVSLPEKFTSHTREILSFESAEIAVSPISSAEIACGIERRKIQLDRHWKVWFRHFVKQNGWSIIPIGLDIVEEAYSLPESFHQDPADRLIVATARLYSLVVVTGDRKILDYPHVESLW